MSRRMKWRVTGGAIVAFALAFTGCGSDTKKVEPKVDANAPKLQPKTPVGPGAGVGGQPGAPKTGAQ
jgi:hypothetical protein